MLLIWLTQCQVRTKSQFAKFFPLYNLLVSNLPSLLQRNSTINFLELSNSGSSVAFCSFNWTIQISFHCKIQWVSKYVSRTKNIFFFMILSWYNQSFPNKTGFSSLNFGFCWKITGFSSLNFGFCWKITIKS